MDISTHFTRRGAGPASIDVAILGAPKQAEKIGPIPSIGKNDTGGAIDFICSSFHRRVLL